MTDQARKPRLQADPPGGSDPALDESTRSEAACPNCGAHRLALLKLPTISTSGYSPVEAVYGMGNGASPDEPGIGCLACGAEWRDLAAFNEAVALQPESSAED